MKTLKDYHDFYLKHDILMSACVINKLRNWWLESYSLCPSNYLSAPALSWDAIPIMTKVELDLISKLDIWLPFEIGMRGYFFYISKRYFKQ